MIRPAANVGRIRIDDAYERRNGRFTLELKSLSRGLQLLEILSRGPQTQGVTDLSRVMEVDKATVSRLLKTLQRHGYVAQDLATRGYGLGPGIVPLGQRALRRMDIRTAAKPFLDLLVAETDECAHLAILYGRSVLYVDQVTSDQTVNVDAPVGTLAPLHCTALGKAMLATQPDQWCQDFIGGQPLRAYTERTITGGPELVEHIAAIRHAGTAIDDEEFSVGIRCMAAPVRGHDGGAAGAIGISGPSPRVTDDRLAKWGPVIQRAAAELSARIGYLADDAA